MVLTILNVQSDFGDETLLQQRNNCLLRRNETTTLMAKIHDYQQKKDYICPDNCLPGHKLFRYRRVNALLYCG